MTYQILREKLTLDGIRALVLLLMTPLITRKRLTNVLTVIVIPGESEGPSFHSCPGDSLRRPDLSWSRSLAACPAKYIILPATRIPNGLVSSRGLLSGLG